MLYAEAVIFNRATTQGTCHPDIAALTNALAEAVELLLARPTWISGDGAPSDDLGGDGDLYLDKLTTDIYIKEDGTWR